MLYVRHLRNQTIDRVAYDACVEAAPNGLVYGLSWWLDVVSPGWEALVLDDYRAVLPLPVKRRYGIRFVEQALFCQRLGIFSRKKPSAVERRAFAENLRAGFPLVTRLCLDASSLADELPAETRQTHCLDLSQPYSGIRDGYNPDRRQNLKRAETAGWEIQHSQNIRPLVEWFRCFHARNIVGGVAPSAYRTLENLFLETERRGLSTLWYAVKNGQPEAGIWFVTYKNRVFFLFNAATPAGRQGNARTFLLDSFFRENADRDLVFDFESPEVPSIAGFYESFGAKREAYVTMSYNQLPFWMNGLWRLKQRLTKKPTLVSRLRGS